MQTHALASVLKADGRKGGGEVGGWWRADAIMQARPGTVDPGRVGGGEKESDSG